MRIKSYVQRVNGRGHPGNLSVPGRMLIDMNIDQYNDRPTTVEIFADPVAYLDTYGILAEVISETSLPAAA